MAFASSCTTPEPKEALVKPQLSSNDVNLADETLQRGLSYAVSEATVEWRSPESGKSGTVTPLRTYTTPDGVYCREYRETLTVSGVVGAFDGVACRDALGIWRPLSESR